MVESAMAVAVMTLVAMVSRSAKLGPETHSKSDSCVHIYAGFWMRDRCVIPFSPAISSVLPAVAYIFSAIPNVLSLISAVLDACLLYTSPSPRDGLLSRMPSSA